ncbi:outer membrane beta-barrel protein [Candidatus Poribacteria bacterium]|nr:outer membrane beta-barrel protein [Candidatus Poribacteria bacterium]
MGGLHLAFDLDYWRWNGSISEYRGDNSSIGETFYASYGFKGMSMAVRLEYIRQGGSKIYTESEKTEDIYAVTLTPTYNFNEDAHIRLETSYIKAKRCSKDDVNGLQDDRIYLVLESGLRF